ncbi:MAG: hypothetical protein KDE27_16655 [Planctomycetes bacterium]|nr:hypothetical protein [Planctomycetota bacterium]
MVIRKDETPEPPGGGLDDDPLRRAVQESRDFHRQMADHPRRRPFGALFQGRDNRELEQRVMTHFYYSVGEVDLGLKVDAYLGDGQDPPDYRCSDRAGRRFGVEIVELVDQGERAENAYRLKRASEPGGHEHSVPVPEGATPGLERMFRENPCMRVYTPDQGIAAIDQLLHDKDRKIAKRRGARGEAWDYDEILVLVFTNNHTIAKGGFYRAAQQNQFGPYSMIGRAFLVAEPFFGIGTPVRSALGTTQMGMPAYGDGIIELPLRCR